MAKKDDDDLLGDLKTETPEEPRDLIDELVEGDAPAWKPEEGEGIQGLVVEVRESINKFKARMPIIVLETAHGRVAVIGAASVLAQQIAEADPQVGDTFAAIFLGRKTSTSGHEYFAYKCKVRPGNGARAVPAGRAGAEQPPF